MNPADVKPKTLDGVKRLATQIKKRDSLKHMEALDVAARQAGFQNFTHARKQLATPQHGGLGELHA